MSTNRFAHLLFLVVFLVSVYGCGQKTPAQEVIQTTPEDYVYKVKVRESLDKIMSYFGELLPLIAQAESNPELLFNSSWISQTKSSLNNISFEANLLSTYSPPVSLNESGNQVDLLVTYLNSFVENFNSYLQTYDPLSMQNAAQDVQNSHRLLEIIIEDFAK